jgi:hypothetical protein
MRWRNRRTHISSAALQTFISQLKSELATLDRKIQLELAPPMLEVVEKEKDGQKVKPVVEGKQNINPQIVEDSPPIRNQDTSYRIEVLINLCG